MINSKNHIKIFSNDWWFAQSGYVKKAEDLSSGHHFVHKVKQGVHPDFVKKQYIKYYKDKPAGPSGTVYKSADDLLEHRMKWNKEKGYTVEKDFVQGVHYHSKRTDRLRGDRLVNEWFDYLETEYLAGNKQVEELMDILSDTGNFDDFFKAEPYQDLVTEFMQKKYGATSLEIEHATLPMPFRKIDPDLVVDTYFIVFNPKDITRIID